MNLLSQAAFASIARVIRSSFSGEDAVQTQEAGIIELSSVNVFLDVKNNTWAVAKIFRKGSVAPSLILAISIIFRDGWKGKFRCLSVTPKYIEPARYGLGFEVREGKPSPKHPPTVVSIIIDGGEVATLTFNIVSSGLSRHAISMEAINR